LVLVGDAVTVTGGDDGVSVGVGLGVGDGPADAPEDELPHPATTTATAARPNSAGRVITVSTLATHRAPATRPPRDVD
jgi:hypothetical protein